MNITVEENERIKITLSADELERSGISFAELDYDSEKSRAFLQKLFFCSKSVTNFEKKGNNLEIEIFPAAKNGCVVYFTPILEIKQVPGYRKLHPPKIAAITAEFSCADALLDFGKALKERKIQVKKSSLYKSGDGYFLILTPFSVDADEVKGLISEFAVLSEKKPSFIKEQYQLLCFEDVLSKMTKYL